MASFFDHTLLKEEATKEDIVRVLEDAKDYGFYGVCIRPQWISLARELLQGTEVKVVTVIAFPSGQSADKCAEARAALDQGAQEIDMVMDWRLIKSGDPKALYQDIEQVAKLCSCPLKVILEVSELNHRQIEEASFIAKTAGAQFVKTSTGYSQHGATREAVQLMRKTVGPDFGVKASGGIRTLEDALTMLEAGANRIGSSSSCAIVDEWMARSAHHLEQ